MLILGYLITPSVDFVIYHLGNWYKKFALILQTVFLDISSSIKLFLSINADVSIGKRIKSDVNRFWRPHKKHFIASNPDGRMPPDGFAPETKRDKKFGKTFFETEKLFFRTTWTELLLVETPHPSKKPSFLFFKKAQKSFSYFKTAQNQLKHFKSLRLKITTVASSYSEQYLVSTMLVLKLAIVECFFDWLQIVLRATYLYRKNHFLYVLSIFRCIGQHNASSETYNCWVLFWMATNRTSSNLPQSQYPQKPLSPFWASV